MRLLVQRATTMGVVAAVALVLLPVESRADTTSEEIVFRDARTQAAEFIGHYKEIQLTVEQEKIKKEALEAIPAPCCAQFTMATCCCPCNLAKSTWGLSAYLIAEQGKDALAVREKVTEWLTFINDEGFQGDACFAGGCERPFAHDGCGGMSEAHIR